MKKILWLIPMVWAAVLLLTWEAWAVDVGFEILHDGNCNGFKLYASSDNGVTWGAPRDFPKASLTEKIWLSGAETRRFYSGVFLNAPNTGVILFRFSAYNAAGETITTENGAWHNELWKLPVRPSGLGF